MLKGKSVTYQSGNVNGRIIKHELYLGQDEGDVGERPCAGHQGPILGADDEYERLTGDRDLVVQQSASHSATYVPG